MADSFYCLGHYAVVRRHDKYGDIRSVGSTHTHRGKRLVSGRIQESDLLSVDLHHICADMLGNTAGFPSCHIGMTDRVKKRGLTVIDMTHNTDYRRSGNHVGLVLFLLFQEFSDHIHLLFRFCDNVILESDLLSLLKVDLLVHRYHDALHEQFLHDH